VPTLDFTIPTVFTQEFFAVANATPPHGPGPKDDTRSFGERMHDLARRGGLHCQNKESKPSGEWMKVDHVFARRNAYDAFPVIAVEHDNGSVSAATKRGEMPLGTTKGTYIEWAFWKALTMRARLGVLVAYPWQGDQDAVLAVLGAMIAGFREEYDHLPPALLLLGWWELPRNATWTSAERLYNAYVPSDDNGIVTLVPLR
jgi:hypothetical protein